MLSHTNNFYGHGSLNNPALPQNEKSKLPSGPIPYIGMGLMPPATNGMSLPSPMMMPPMMPMGGYIPPPPMMMGGYIPPMPMMMMPQHSPSGFSSYPPMMVPINPMGMNSNIPSLGKQPLGPKNSQLNSSNNLSNYQSFISKVANKN